MRWVSGPGLRGWFMPDFGPYPSPLPRPPSPQELAEGRAGLQAQEQELCKAQGQQDELLQRLQEAQEREVATAIQTQALSSQLEEARAAQREVGDQGGKGQRPGPAPSVAGGSMGSLVGDAAP